MKSKNKVGFFTDMLRGANGGISSKRVLGGFILLVLLTVIVIGAVRGIESTWLGEAFITMEVGGFALLGISLFEKKTTTKQITHYGDSDECPETEETEVKEEDQCL